MDKLQMAHEYFMKHGRDGSWMEFDVASAWQYADAMQAEADKRVNKERPKVLFEPKCEVDWRVAPKDAIGWMIFDGVSTWLGASGYLIEDAPSFGFTGSHVVERPHGF